MLITERIAVDAPLDAAYGLLADTRRWPAVMPDIEQVDVLYTDGYNEILSITGRWRGQRATTREVRYRRPPHEVEFFRPAPPPGLTRMAGWWRFTEENGRTLVTAGRDLCLPDEPREPDGGDSVETQLRGILRHWLGHFAEAVERERLGVSQREPLRQR